jgi:hypothetical protein
VNSTTVILESTLVCPLCGHMTLEVMPTDSCQFFYECVQCHTVIRPKKGDCCVFCSWGSVECPPVQLQSRCCNHSGESDARHTHIALQRSNRNV